MPSAAVIDSSSIIESERRLIESSESGFSSLRNLAEPLLA